MLLLLSLLLWALWRPLLCAAGGVWREGDAGEEQRHFQRWHPQPAEGEQVGHSSDVCFYTSTAVIECETELRVECLAQGHAGLTPDVPGWTGTHEPVPKPSLILLACHIYSVYAVRYENCYFGDYYAEMIPSVRYNYFILCIYFVSLHWYHFGCKTERCHHWITAKNCKFLSRCLDINVFTPSYQELHYQLQLAADQLFDCS